MFFEKITCICMHFKIHTADYQSVTKNEGAKNIPPSSSFFHRGPLENKVALGCLHLFWDGARGLSPQSGER